MNFFKKTFLFILAILLCTSIYHDITSGSISTKKEKNVQTTTSNSAIYNRVRVQVMPGDTVLSIVEKYNDGKLSMDIDQIITDFQKLNEDANPYQLKSYHYYFFPVYKKVEG